MGIFYNPPTENESIFTVLRPLGATNLPDVKGNFYDLKKRVEFSVNVIHAGVDPQYNLFSFYVDIIKLDATGFHRFDLTNRFTNLMLPLTSIGDKSADSDADFEYEFDDTDAYKITYTITMTLGTNTSQQVALYHTQIFKYYDIPVTLNPNITISDLNIGKGDTIKIGGLTLVNGTPNDIPTDNKAIQFSFRDTATNMEHAYTEYQPYDPSGNYTLINNQLDDNKKYKVIVTARWPLGYTTSVEGDDTLYVIPRPIIKQIVPLSVSGPIIATMYVKKDYTGNVYSERKIKFTFYNSETGNAVTKDIEYDIGTDASGVPITDASGVPISRATTALGGVDSYVFNLRANDFSIKPYDGIIYKVKSEITLKYSTVEQNRVSNFYILPDSFSPQTVGEQTLGTNQIVLTKNVGPITDVTIDNTWALITNPDNVPSSNEALFRNSRVPRVGISGYFKKTAQFKGDSPKHLDTTTTKFKLEYKTESALSWSPVVRAVFKQKSSTDVSNNVAVYEILDDTLQTASDGMYDNRFDASSNLVGTSQPEIVFYIPKNQKPDDAAHVSFDETHRVQVRVTVVDTANTFGGSIVEAKTLSAEKQIINKVESYDFVVGESTEPWNTENPYVDVTMNGTPVSNVTKTQVKADSKNIIEEVDQGWKILNTGVNTNGAVNGALPKVNLYFYGNTVAAASQTSSNSFQVNQMSGLGAYAIIDQHAGAKEYPFFIAYTTPTASDNKASWYKSKLFYAPDAANNQWNLGAGINPGDTVTTPSRVGLTLLYTGTDVASFRPDIPASRRIKHSVLPHDGVLTNANSTYATELVNLVSLQTSSNASASQAGSFNFTLQESGLTTSSSVLSSLVMKFSKNIALNIPVDWKSIYAHSLKVSYGYDENANLISKTFAQSETQAVGSLKYVSILVNPTSGSTLYYTVAYIVNNTNEGATTEGLTVSKNVPNKYFPTSSNYSISGDSYKTFNSHAESSISLTLGFTPGLTHRIDGVNVYFASPSGANGSNINKVRIATYKSDAAGSKTIKLLRTDSQVNVISFTKENNVITYTDNNTALNVINSQGQPIVHESFKWGDFDLANITFEAYRDHRVQSGTSIYTGAAYDNTNTTPYKESGSKSFSKTIWNVPQLKKISDYGRITLTGGVRNSSVQANITPTAISWPSINDTNGTQFKYALKMDKGSVSGSYEDLTVASKTLTIDKTANANYTVNVKLVFEPSGADREESQNDVIAFSTIDVDVSGMDIRVQDPSDTSRVNLSWVNPVVNGGTNAANIHSQYIEYLISGSTSRSRLAVPVPDASGNIPLIETLTSGKKEYTLPANTTVRMLYEFYMHIKAHIGYTVNSNSYTTDAVPILDSTSKTPESQYVVSSIPSISSLSVSPVLNTTTVKPTLALNLDARGMEAEGFISVVILLTQDGTPSKPDGEQVLLVFPGTATAPFNINNTVPSTSGSNLVSGSVSTTTPRNQSNTSLSTQPSSLEYSLKIGAPVADGGPYGPSELTMPYSSDSGFVEGGSANPINYMVILTSRRGTDVNVGSFEYVALPSVRGLSISYDTNTNQYSANFNINE